MDPFASRMEPWVPTIVDVWFCNWRYPIYMGSRLLLKPYFLQRFSRILTYEKHIGDLEGLVYGEIATTHPMVHKVLKSNNEDQDIRVSTIKAKLLAENPLLISIIILVRAKEHSD